MEVISARRFLARTLWIDGECRHLQLVDLTSGRLSVSPFYRETEATIFVSGRVVLLNRVLFEENSSDLLKLSSVDQLLDKEHLAHDGMSAEDVVAVII